ncbi:uncharacterized protein PV09_01229 [Verruconis gallopava]|uniref:Uncharacterized protein n=1 Tax=Verruconis gallopava TaxID=253628 RepID=A0A0D2AP34_9PEZI|nr:uncharacterized protein PV09_01229 [Verruconis gallopava]KIW08310.1 hypothetical protein PV09_01229 [Verruconis gallopava]
MGGKAAGLVGAGDTLRVQERRLRCCMGLEGKDFCGITSERQQRRRRDGEGWRMQRVRNGSSCRTVVCARTKCARFGRELHGAGWSDGNFLSLPFSIRPYPSSCRKGRGGLLGYCSSLALCCGSHRHWL